MRTREKYGIIGTQKKDSCKEHNSKRKEQLRLEETKKMQSDFNGY